MLNKIGPVKKQTSIKYKKVIEFHQKAIYFDKGKKLAIKTKVLPKWLAKAICDIRSAITFLTTNDVKHRAFISGIERGRNLDKLS